MGRLLSWQLFLHFLFFIFTLFTQLLLCFFYIIGNMIMKFSLQSNVKPRSFCECVFSVSKLVTDILVFISRLERKGHLSGFVFIVSLRNHSNIYLDAHSSFSKTLEIFHVCREIFYWHNLQRQLRQI